MGNEKMLHYSEDEGFLNNTQTVFQNMLLFRQLTNIQKIFGDLYDYLELSPSEGKSAHLLKFDDVMRGTRIDLMNMHETFMKTHPIIIGHPGHYRKIQITDETTKAEEMLAFGQQVDRQIATIRNDFSTKLDNEDISLADIKQFFLQSLDNAIEMKSQLALATEQPANEINDHLKIPSPATRAPRN